jgi:hypothetical protein
MAVIGADKPANSDEWLVMISGDVNPRYLDVDAARKLANALARIGEMMLAQRLSGAAETAQRQMLRHSRAMSARLAAADPPDLLRSCGAPRAERVRA